MSRRAATPASIGIRIVIGVIVAAALFSRCKINTGGDGESGADIPKGCAAIEVASSPEKVDLLTELAEEFNDSDEADVDGTCAFVRVASGCPPAPAPTALAEGWPTRRSSGPQPGHLVAGRQRVGRGPQPAAGRQRPATGHGATDAKPFMRHAARHRHAPADGRRRSAGRTRRSASPTSSPSPRTPTGWAAKGHPEWGAFKLGKTNPNFSTSGLSATIAQYYAATGKTRDLTLEDLNRPEVDDVQPRASSRPSCTTATSRCTFLNNWYRNDARGTALTYVSAVAVEEKSVIDYNRGNPDGITRPRRDAPKPPRVPLVADLPEGRHALLRQPVLRPRRAVGRRRSRRPAAPGVHRLRPAAREPAAGAEVRVPSRQPRRWRSARRSTPPTASTPTSRRPRSGARRRTVLVRAHRASGTSSARARGCCW